MGVGVGDGVGDGVRDPPAFGHSGLAGAVFPEQATSMGISISANTKYSINLPPFIVFSIISRE